MTVWIDGESVAPTTAADVGECFLPLIQLSSGSGLVVVSLVTPEEHSFSFLFPSVQISHNLV